MDTTLHTSVLLERGFHRAGDWQLGSDRNLQFRGEASDAPGVYAFCMQGEACYVGLASRSLKKRLYFYQRPGSSQRTNRRLNETIRAVLSKGEDVDVFIASPPDFEWNGFPVLAAQGLEAGLLRTFDLCWNVRGGNGPSRSEPLAATMAKTQAQRRKAAGGKYAALGEHLRASGRERVSMTFAEIEALVGKLPKSAHLHPAWWANHEGNSQAKSWIGARYLVEANPAARSVVFRRFSR